MEYHWSERVKCCVTLKWNVHVHLYMNTNTPSYTCTSWVFQAAEHRGVCLVLVYWNDVKIWNPDKFYVFFFVDLFVKCCHVSAPGGRLRHNRKKNTSKENKWEKQRQEIWKFHQLLFSENTNWNRDSTSSPPVLQDPALLLQTVWPCDRLNTAEFWDQMLAAEAVQLFSISRKEKQAVLLFASL